MENIILLKHPKNWGLEKSVVLEQIKRALKTRKINNSEISLLFVGRKRAKDLNIKYRNKSYIPQVLGFPMKQDRDPDGMIRLGDIVVCTQKLKYEAVLKQKTIKEVLGEWLLHGVDNLLIQ